MRKLLGWSYYLRSRLAILLIAIAIVVGVAVAAPLASPKPAAALSPAGITSWFMNYLQTKVGQESAAGILEQQGWDCRYGPLLCFSYTSYDPPKIFRYGVVKTGSATGYVNARAWQRTNATVIRTFPENWKLVIFCQTTGDWVYGRWGWTNIWNYVGHYGAPPMFVSDGFVYTGTNGYVAGDCHNTNYGGNPI